MNHVLPGILITVNTTKSLTNPSLFFKTHFNNILFIHVTIYLGLQITEMSEIQIIFPSLIPINMSYLAPIHVIQNYRLSCLVILHKIDDIHMHGAFL